MESPVELPAAISAEELGSETSVEPSREGKSGVQAAFNLPGIHSEPAFFASVSTRKLHHIVG